MHARGPIGLKELTTYKYIIQGNYTVRDWNEKNRYKNRK
jgi:glutamate-5-semialdehyde dehydrogenase